MQLKILRFLFVLLFFASPAFATDYYVSTTGNDSGSCTAIDSGACLTVGAAIGKASNGDTIYVQAGTYDLDDEPSDYLNVSKQLTITAYDQENMPLILGTHSDWRCIIITAASTLSYLKIHHGTSRSGESTGCVRIQAEPTTIDHCEVWYGGHGVEVLQRRNLTITNNDLSHNGTSTSPPPDPESGNGHGIVINTDSGTQATGWSEKIYIAGNTMSDNYGDGFQTGNSYEGKYIELYNNSLYDNWEDGIDLKYCTYVRIHGNLIYSNDADGMVTHGPYGGGYPTNIEFYDNTIYSNDWWGIILGSSTNFEIWNNVFYLNGAEALNEASGTARAVNISGCASVVFHHNVVHGNYDGVQFESSVTAYNNSIWNNNLDSGTNCVINSATTDYNHMYPTCSGMGAHSISDTDPLFTNAPGRDYTIQANSPLNDTGNYLSGYATDRNGNARYNGTYIGPDIGVYEYQYSSSPVTINHTNWDACQSASSTVLDTVTDTLRVFFGHVSCGYDIVSDNHGTGTGGWDNLPSQYQMTTFYSTGSGWPTNTQNLSAGMLYHGSLLDNEYGTCKTKDLIDHLADQQANSRYYYQDVDVAFHKFCFTDLDTNAQEDNCDYLGSVGTSCDFSGSQNLDDATSMPGFVECYISQMEDAIVAYPDIKFVMFTAKLQNDGCSATYMCTNHLMKNTMSAIVREIAAANGYHLFDMADIDSYGDEDDLATCTYGSCTNEPTFHADWRYTDGDHYNTPGATHLAYAMVSLLTELYTDAGSGGTSSPTMGSGCVMSGGASMVKQ